MYSIGNFKLEGSLNSDFIFSNYNGSLTFLSLWKPLARNRLFPLEYVYSNSELLLRLQTQRLYISYSSFRFSVKLGRQAVSWGQGRFLNPLDLITPIQVLILDIDDISGVDALNASFFLNETDFLEFILIPYRRNNYTNYNLLRYNDINALLRWKATYWDTDIIVLSGYHFHSLVWGAEGVRSFFSFLWRLAYLGRYEWEKEVQIDSSSYTLTRNSRHQIVIGMDKVFFKKLRTNFEIFMNFSANNDHETLQALSAYENLVLLDIMAPLPQDTTFFRTQGRLITRNPVLLECSLSYELLESSSLSLFFIYDPKGSSAVFIPQWQYSIDDNHIWTTGGQFFVYRNENSEFYRRNIRVYSFLKFYL